MLTIQGTRRRLCDGVVRRDFLQLGGLGLLGLGLADLFRQQAQAATTLPERTFGKAKA